MLPEETCHKKASILVACQPQQRPTRARKRQLSTVRFGLCIVGASVSVAVIALEYDFNFDSTTCIEVPDYQCYILQRVAHVSYSFFFKWSVPMKRYVDHSEGIRRRPAKSL
jgi:hypothetical protein